MTTFIGVGATAAHASDPGGGGGCGLSVSGFPGNETFTLNVDNNPCGYPMRAWSYCFSEIFPPCGWTSTGSVVSSSGSHSVAGCAPGEIAQGSGWGYDYYGGGAWHRYDMNTDTWLS